MLLRILTSTLAGVVGFTAGTTWASALVPEAWPLPLFFGLGVGWMFTDMLRAWRNKESLLGPIGPPAKSAEPGPGDQATESDE